MCMDLNTGLGSFLGIFGHSLSGSLSLPVGLCYHGKHIRFGGRKLGMNLINKTIYLLSDFKQGTLSSFLICRKNTTMPIFRGYCEK